MATTFQNNLKQALNGIRLEPFCKKIGISYKGLRSMMSRGLVKPSAKSEANLEKIGKALGFNPDELWHEQMPLTKEAKLEAKFKQEELVREIKIKSLEAEIASLKDRQQWWIDQGQIWLKKEDELKAEIKRLKEELKDCQHYRRSAEMLIEDLENGLLQVTTDGRFVNPREVATTSKASKKP
jgi:chromosome segregation ATPase